MAAVRAVEPEGELAAYRRRLIGGFLQRFLAGNKRVEQVFIFVFLFVKKQRYVAMQTVLLDSVWLSLAEHLHLIERKPKVLEKIALRARTTPTHC